MAPARRAKSPYALSGDDDSGADYIAELILRVAKCDRDAFDELYARTSAKLFGVALRILNDRAEAEEALQEIFLKVWRAADRFEIAEFSAMSWLIAIARNHAIDRARKRRARLSLRDSNIELDAAISLIAAAPTPEETAARGSERQRLERCLAELDPKHAHLVRGAYLEGKSYKQLAQETGAPVNTVRTWLRRSLRKLRESLGE